VGSVSASLRATLSLVASGIKLRIPGRLVETLIIVTLHRRRNRHARHQ
jgi:hypothetical protein